MNESEHFLEIGTVLRGKWVTLEVIDSGCGVRLEHRKDLFTPFFSIKTGGMGLGLAIAGRILDAHGGIIFFKPNSAKGTTFRAEFHS
jgi:signal transduction histidine kinase